MSKLKAFMTIIENIYFSAIPTGNFDFKELFDIHLKMSMQNLKDKSFKEDIYLFEKVEVLSSGIGRYPYGFYIDEKVRIYFANNWTDNYPIYIIVSAQFLHTEKVKTVLDFCSEFIAKIIKHFLPKEYDMSFLYKLSRIDICNHTTKIKMDNYILITEYFSRVSTRLGKVFPVVEKSGEGKQEVPYFRYGKGDFCVRFYNKTKEVCEQQYKPFFIEKWKDSCLIDDNSKRIYENIYKLQNNYRVDYLFSNIIFSFDVSTVNNYVVDLVRIYNNVDITNCEKIDIFNAFIKSNKIKLVPEITNVEFQLRSGFLKTIKVIDKETGEYFDFCDMEILFNNVDILYNYLTTKLFRVVDRKSNAKRIRDKTTDPIWEEVQNCNIENINMDIKIKNAEIYRQYNENMNKFITTRDGLKKLVHLKYLCSDDINFKNLNDISIDDICENVKSECSLNENYFNLNYLLAKQLKNYGAKGADIPEEKKYTLSCIDEKIDFEYVKNLIFDLKYFGR